MGKRALFAIFATALFARLLNMLVLLLSEADLLALDASYYWALGTWIKDGGWAYMNLSDPTNPLAESERMPLYPYFIAVLKTVFGDSLAAVLTMQAMLDAATCTIIAHIAGYWSARAGLFAGLLAALSPNMIVHAGSILTDTLFLFLFSAGLLMAVRFLAIRSLPPLAGGGLLLGAATLTRSLTFPLVGVVAAAAAIISWVHDRSIWRALHAAGIFALCAALPLAPWLSRNFTQFDSIALSSQSGTHFLFWGVGIAKQYHLGLPFSEISKRLNIEIERELERRGQASESMNAMQRSALLKDVALTEAPKVPISSYLKAWTWAAAVNFAAPSIALHPVVRADKTGSYYDTAGASLLSRAKTFLAGNGAVFVTAILGGGIFTLIANVLTACGFFVLLARYPWMAIFAALSIAYFCVTNGPVVSPKYRLPMEPTLIALMAIGLAEWRTVASWVGNRIGRQH